MCVHMLYDCFSAVSCRWSGDCWSAWRGIICSCWQERIKEKRKQGWPRNRRCTREERFIFPYLSSPSSLFLSLCLYFSVFLYFYGIINSVLEIKYNVLFWFLNKFQILVTCNKLPCIFMQLTSYPQNFVLTNQKFDNLNTLVSTNKYDFTVFPIR